MSEIDHYKKSVSKLRASYILIHYYSHIHYLFFEKQFFVFRYMSYSKSENSDESSLEALFNIICAYKIGICNLNLEIDIDLYLLCLNLTAILTIS